MRKFTMKDVAREAGVSIATVSRVINGTGNVNAFNEKKVRETVAKMKYNVNVIAKNLKESKTNSIGIIIPDISNPHFMTVSKGIEDTIEQFGYQLIFGSSNESPVKEEQLLRLFYGKQVEAVVVATSGDNDNIIRNIQEQGTPVILIDRSLDEMNSRFHLIEEDNKYGAYHLTKKMIELGHTHIGVVNGPLHVSTGMDRYQGYVEALADAGVSEKENQVFYGDFSRASGRKAVKFFMSNKPPTAILSFNNLMSIGVIMELVNLDIKIPDEILVASYGMVEPVDLLTDMYNILCVRSSPYEIGKRVGSILIENLVEGNKDKVYRETLKPEIYYKKKRISKDSNI